MATLFTVNYDNNHLVKVCS